jgi:hypothetical protein
MCAMNKFTLLEKVQDRLYGMHGKDMLAVAYETNISYDTLRRIKLNLCDPAFSKVQRLAEHFRLVRK